MKILFLHPPWPGKGYGLRSQNRWPRKRGDKSNRYPILLCYTATLLKNNGHDVKYMDSVIQDMDVESTFSEIAKFNPEIVFIETSTSTFIFDKEFVSMLKKKFPAVKAIVAGSHVTYDPAGSIKDSKIDFIVKGEQDYTTLNLVNAIAQNKPFSSINGICYQDGRKIVNNPPAELIKDLDSLPFPDRDLIPHQWYIEGHVKKLPFTFVMASRGCPNHCAYCLWPNVYFEHRVRFRSTKNILDEVEWLIKKYGMKEIFFDDDTFNTSKQRVMDICSEIIKRGIKILWSCSARVDIIDKEMLDLMKQSGCKLICYGGESANQNTLNRVQKGISVEQVRRATGLTKKAGIITHLNFMLGFPWESREEMENTINLALELEPDTVQFSLVFPHPGSKMFAEAVEKGWFYDDVVGNWSIYDMAHGPVLKTGLDRKELASIVSKAHARFFMRPSYILKQLWKVRDFQELKRTIRGAKSIIKGKILFKGEVK